MASMRLNNSDLDQAILPLPPIVKADTLLREVMLLMSQSQAVDLSPTEQPFRSDRDRNSCVFVVEGEHLIGILTERDLVQQIAETSALDQIAIAQIMTENPITLKRDQFQDIFTILNLFRQYRFRHLPILDEQQKLMGVVTPSSLRQLLQPIDLLKMRRIQEVMSKPVIQAIATTPLTQITQLMVTHHVSCVIITEPLQNCSEALVNPIGIITERDIVQFRAQQLDFQQTQAQRVMVTPLICLKPNDFLWDAHQQMQHHQIRRLGVVGDSGELLGIVTQTSILQTLDPWEMYKKIDFLQEQVLQLEAEKIEFLKFKNHSLEQQVQERTQALQEQSDRDRLLTLISQRIRQSLKLQDILQTTVTEVQHYLQCDRVLIYQFQADYQGIVVAESVVNSNLSLLHQIITDLCFIQDWVDPFNNGRIRATDNIDQANLSEYHLQILKQFQIRSQLVVPIIQDNQLWGLLAAHHCQEARQWQVSETKLLQQLAVQIEIAISQAKAYEFAQQEILERQKSERNYANLTEVAPVGIFRTDTQGNYLYVNDRWCEIAGLTSTEALDQGWMNSIHPEDRNSLLQEWENALREQRPFRLEYRFRRSNHQDTWVFSQSVAERNSENEIIGYIGTITDITDRKRAEESLARSEEEHRLLFEANPSPMWIYEPKTFKFLAVNQAAIEHYGYSEQEFLSMTVLDIRLETDIPEFLQIMQEENSSQLVREWRHRKKDGTIIYVEITAHQITWADEPARFVLAQDITDRKAAELELQTLNQELELRVNQRTAALQASEKRFRTLFEVAPDFIQVLDPQGIILETNLATINLSGYTKQELCGSPLKQFLTPESQSIYTEQFSQQLPTGFEHQEVEFVCKNGMIRIMDCSGGVVYNDQGDVDYVVLLQRDISDRKASEKELKRLIKELSNFKYALDQAAIAAITDTDGVITYVNEQFCQNSQYSREELIGKTHKIINSGYHPPAFFQNLWDTIKRGQVWRGEICNRAKDNSHNWTDCTIVPLMDEHNQPSQYLAIRTDITSRKLAEEALRESEQKFRQLAENIGQVFWITDPQQKAMLYISPAYEEIWQRSRESLYENPWSFVESIHPEDREYYLPQFENKITGFDLEYRVIRPSGEIRWIRDRAFPIRNEQGEVYRVAGIAEDITKRKQVESEIHKSLEKERELNELKSRFISMTSHEFRTPLAVISSSAGILKDFGHKLNEEKKHHHLQCIQTYVKHTTQLLDDILLINRAESGYLALNPTLTHLGDFCQSLLNEMQLNAAETPLIFSIETRAGEDAPTEISKYANVYIDQKVLRQILANLLSNAIKYSPKTSEIHLKLILEEQQAIFNVQDAGIGIPPEDQKHLFDLFHRAQNVGNIPGSGLGLSIVKKCVELQGGTITVASEVGVGTTFTITLPVSRESVVR